MKYMIKKIIIGVVVGFILFNLKACNVHAYVYLRSNNGNGGITNNTSNLTNVNGNWGNRYIFGFGTSDWIYDIGQYFNADLGSGGNELVVVADYYFGIETNGSGSTTPTSYLNSDRNTLTANNLRCGIGSSYASGYDSTYTPTISNFSVTRSVGLYDWPQETYHVTFTYKQKLSSTYSGNSNLSCWFQRQPSNGLVVQVSGSPSVNLYFGYTVNLQYSLSGDPNTSALQTITSQNQTMINQNQTMINQNNTIIQEEINTQNKINENTNAINNNTQAINDVKNTMTNSEVNSPYDKLNDVKNSVSTNNVISDLVLLPITLFRKINNSINGSCSPYNLGVLFGTDLIMPCLNIQNLVGSTLWSVIDVLFCGLFIWYITRQMIKVFNRLSTLKDGDVLYD